VNVFLASYETLRLPCNPTSNVFAEDMSGQFDKFEWFAKGFLHADATTSWRFLECDFEAVSKGGYANITEILRERPMTQVLRRHGGQ